MILKTEFALCLGSNIGNKRDNLEQAILVLSKKFQFIERSHFYESDPVDYVDQDKFLNMVAIFSTGKLTSTSS